jgi:hypothetical protein
LIKDLEQVQRRAARFSQYTDTSPGCVTALLDQLEWDPLQHRRRKQRLALCYKIRNHLVDIDPADHYTPGDSRTRGGGINTDNRPPTRKSTETPFSPRSIRDWNHLPETISSAPSLEEFRARLASVPWTQMDSWQRPTTYVYSLKILNFKVEKCTVSPSRTGVSIHSNRSSIPIWKKKKKKKKKKIITDLYFCHFMYKTLQVKSYGNINTKSFYG